MAAFIEVPQKKEVIDAILSKTVYRKRLDALQQ
jgi:hypothetical protein